MELAAQPAAARPADSPSPPRRRIRRESTKSDGYMPFGTRDHQLVGDPRFAD